ncbi:MAG: hypothetical protein AAF171_06625 [Cyanobacteria bacterium P01_A01_bin.116]
MSADFQRSQPSTCWLVGFGNSGLHTHTPSRQKLYNQSYTTLAK